MKNSELYAAKARNLRAQADRFEELSTLARAAERLESEISNPFPYAVPDLIVQPPFNEHQFILGRQELVRDPSEELLIRQLDP